MTDVSKTYFDLPSRLERDFAEIDSKIVMNLYDTNNEYAQLQQQISDLTKKYPFIENVIEGEGEIHISNDEHEVLIQYFKLNRKLSDMERLHIYFCGHTDAVAYLKKIKAI